MDYFEFMGLPRQMGFDPTLLEKRFYELSRQYHPDLVQGKSDKEKIFSHEKSAFLNKAYKTLKDPVERAGYLLDLEAPGPQKERTQIDPALVSEIFEIQEMVEEEKRTKDPSLKTKLLTSQKEVEEKITVRRTLLGAYFKEWDLSGNDLTKKQELAQTIRKTIDEITYLRNLLQSIESGGLIRH